jgi:hypothetical protein
MEGMVSPHKVRFFVVVLYANEWDFEGRRGSTIHYMTEPVNEPTAKGSQVVKATADARMFSLLEEVPGIYEMEFVSGGRAGKPSLKLDGMSFAGSVKIAGEQLEVPVVVV